MAIESGNIADMPQGFFQPIPDKGNVASTPQNFFTDIPQQSESLFIESTQEVVDLPEGGLSRLSAIASEAYKKGDAATDINALSFMQVFGASDPKVQQSIDSLSKTASRKIKTDGWFEEGLRASSEQIPMLRNIFIKGSERGMQSAMMLGGSALLLGQAGPQAALPEELLTVPAASLAGIGVGMMAGSVEESFTQMTGGAYREFSQIKDVDGNFIDPDVAKVGALMAGSVGAGLEMVPLSLIFKVIPGSKKIFSKLGAKAGQAIGIPTSKKAMKNFLINMSTIVTAETAVEGAQEGVNIAVGEGIKFLDVDDFEAIEGLDAVNRVTESMVEALKGTPLIAAGPSTARLGVDVIAARGEKKKEDAVKSESPQELNVASPEIDAVTEKVAALPIKDGVAKADLTKEEVSTLGEVGVKVVDGTIAESDVSNLVEAQNARAEAQEAAIAESAKIESAAQKVAEARLSELDDRIESTDSQIDQIYSEIVVRADEGRRTTRLEQRVEKLLERRDVMDSERQSLYSGELSRSEVQTDLANFDVKVKGRDLVNQEKKLSSEKRRNLQKGFVEGRKMALNNIQEAQAFLTDLIDKSGLSLADKSKFIKTITGLTDAKQLQKKLPAIQSRIENLLDQSRRRELKDSISKLIKKAKVTSQAGKPKGKLTPEVHSAMDDIKRIFNMTQEQAKEILAATSFTDAAPTPEQALQNRMLQIAAGNANTQEIESVLGAITEMVETGRVTAEIKQLSKIADQANNRILARSVLGGAASETIDHNSVKERIRKVANNFRGTISSLVNDWDNTVDIITGHGSKENAKKFNELMDVFEQEHNKRELLDKKQKEVTQVFMDAFGFSTEAQLMRQMREDTDSKIDYGFFTNSRGEKVRLQLTKAEARKRLMELRDDSIADTIRHKKGNAYTQEMINAINESMSIQDMKLIDGQMAWYQSFYNEINKVYKDVYGVNLPRNENYSPISRDHHKDDRHDKFLKEMYARATAASGSLKSRVETTASLRDSNDIDVIQRHMMEMVHFIAFQEKAQEISSVFNDAGIRKAIEQRYGRFMLKNIDSLLDKIITSGSRMADAHDSLIDMLRKNMVTSVLGLKPALAIKQMTSFPAYLEQMPTKDFMAGLADFMKNPKAAIEVLNESAFFRNRSNSITRDIQDATSSQEFSAFRTKPTLKNALMLFTRLGDKGAIALGGWPVYKYNIAQGKTHAEALKAFEKASLSAQQSSDVSKLSVVQQGSPIAKLFTMFTTSLLQYSRKEAAAIRNLARGRATKKEVAKTIFIYHFLLPQLFQWVSNVFRWDEEDQARAAIMGPFNGVAILGDIVEAVAATISGADVYRDKINVTDFAFDLINGMSQLTEDDMDFEDYLEAVKRLAEGGGKMTGYPVEQIFNIGEGIADIAEGDEAGAYKILGWPSGAIQKNVEK